MKAASVHPLCYPSQECAQCVPCGSYVRDRCPVPYHVSFIVPCNAVDEPRRIHDGNISDAPAAKARSLLCQCHCRAAMPQRSIEPADREQLDDPHFTILNYIANAVPSLHAESIAH